MQNKKFILTILSYALIMLFVGPLLGVLHQESSKKLSKIQFTDKDLSNIKVTSLLEIESLKQVFEAKEKKQEIYLQKLDKLSCIEQINLVLKDKEIRLHFLTFYRQHKELLPNPELAESIDKSDSISEYNNTKRILGTALKIPESKELNEFEMSLVKDSLARVHGHAILIGCVIPVVMCIILWFSTQLGGTPITDRSLRVVSSTYISSSIITISLMLIKGYSFNISARHGITNWTEMNDYILSSHGLKAALYGTVHTVTFVSLYYFIFKVFQSLNGRAEITEAEILNKKMRMIYINAIIWVGIGCLLVYRGIYLFPETSSSTFLIALIIGAVGGAAKGYFVLAKTGRKNVKRISLLQKPVQYTSTIPIILFLLIPLMIGFGLLLKSNIERLPGGAYTVGAVYVGIGSALLVASLVYWMADLKKKV